MGCVKIGVHSMVSIVHFSSIYTLQCYNCNFYKLSLQVVILKCMGYRTRVHNKYNYILKENAMPSVRSLNCYPIVDMTTPCIYHGYSC